MVGPTKVSIIKMKCIVQNKLWQHDFIMKKIFSVQYFCQKTQADWLSRLTTQATIPDTQGINMSCNNFLTPHFNDLLPHATRIGQRCSKLYTKSKINLMVEKLHF